MRIEGYEFVFLYYFFMKDKMEKKFRRGDENGNDGMVVMRVDERMKDLKDFCDEIMANLQGQK